MLSECVECARCFWRYPDCDCKEGFLAPPPLRVPELETDIHRKSAAKMFGVSYWDVTDEQRRAAKTIDFGLTYGASI